MQDSKAEETWINHGPGVHLPRGNCGLTVAEGGPGGGKQTSTVA